MLQGYYDDSADEGAATVFAVGGFVAEREAWNTYFLPAWRNFLRREGLEYFRMSEAVRHNGPYEKWSGQHGIDCLAELVTIIRRTTNLAVTFTVRMEDFRAYKDRLDGILTRPVLPFHLCAALAIQEVRKKWQFGKPGLPPVEHIFESGTQGTGDLMATLGEMAGKWPEYFTSPEGGSFQSKRNRLQLQAADIMAYETMLAEKRKPEIEGWSDYRKIVQDLLAPPMERIEGTIGVEYIQELLKVHAERHGYGV